MSDSPPSNVLQRIRRNLARTALRAALTPCDFSIIANDCWGGEIYRRLKLPYRTPFVGLYLMTPCFIRMLEQKDLRGFLAQPLKWIEHSRYEAVMLEKKRIGNYPSALLGGEVEIHFMHYRSREEATEKWSRRLQRVNWDNLIFKMDYGKDLATVAHLKRFEALGWQKKLAFGPQPHIGLPHAVAVQNYTAHGVDMVRRVAHELNLVRWLQTGEIRRFNGKVFGWRRSLHASFWQWL